MAILDFPVPKLARRAGPYRPRRGPNWFRTVAVATSRVEPRGSFDPGPSCDTCEGGKPLLTRSAHTWASHDTIAAGLTWFSIQLIACVLAVAAAASGLIWLPVSCSGDAPRRERVNATPPAPAASMIKVNSTAARQRRDARPFARRLRRGPDAGSPAIRPSVLPTRGSGSTASTCSELIVFSSVSRADATGGIGPMSRAPAATSSLSASRADGLTAGSLLRQRWTREPSGSGSLPTFGAE